jgi:photosystem II stability/assembly factor-like uncharacterized protein
MRTTDGGVTWQNHRVRVPDEFDLAPRSFNDIQFITASTGWVVGTAGSILRTTDGGATWVAQVSNTSADLKRIQFINSQIGWVLGDRVVLRTTDGGATWQPASLVSKADFLYGFAFSSTMNGWLVGATIFNSKIELFRTIDGGASWQSSAPPPFSLLQDVAGPSGSPGYLLDLFGRVYVQTKPNDTWVAVAAGAQNDRFLRMQFVGTNTIWGIGSEGLIAKLILN